MSDAEALRLAGIVIAVAMLAAAVLMVVVTGRAADGRLGPNQWAGMRTKETLAGPRQWRAAHEAARGATWVAAIGMGAAGLVAALVHDPGLLAGVTLAGAIWALVWLLVGLMRGEQAARQVRGHPH